jgi:hypothetical protein
MRQHISPSRQRGRQLDRYRRARALLEPSSGAITSDMTSPPPWPVAFPPFESQVSAPQHVTLHVFNKHVAVRDSSNSCKQFFLRDEGERIELGKWGFLPEGWKNSQMRPQNNARLETAATKPAGMRSEEERLLATRLEKADASATALRIAFATTARTSSMSVWPHCWSGGNTTHGNLSHPSNMPGRARRDRGGSVACRNDPALADFVRRTTKWRDQYLITLPTCSCWQSRPPVANAIVSGQDNQEQVLPGRVRFVQTGRPPRERARRSAFLYTAAIRRNTSAQFEYPHRTFSGSWPETGRRVSCCGKRTR